MRPPTPAYRATGLRDQNQFYRWARGESVPNLTSLIAIAHAFEVSLDWLVLGKERTPAALEEWLASPQGAVIEDDAKRYLRSLPTRGYDATPAFYALSYNAWKHGLAGRVDPAKFGASVRETARRKAAAKSKGSKG